ncbi:MAG TPA: hypothetical protein VGI98_06855 [Candidatus Limnocylindrales bacterium]
MELAAIERRRPAMLQRFASILVVALLVAGCASAGGSPGSSEPGPSPSPGAALTEGDLRVQLVKQLGPRWYCDPDYFPIARPSFDEGQAAVERFGDIQADADNFNAILGELGLTGTTTFTDAQKLAIYQAWKPLVTIALDPAGDGRYAFDYLAMPVGTGQSGIETKGTIDTTGRISVDSSAAAGPPNCPICLAAGTPIDGPSGAIPVDLVRVGDVVWTVDAAGRRAAAVVTATGSTIAPATHRVIRMTLADGRTVTASPGHPLGDGRPLGSLHLGDEVDGSVVTALEWLPYGYGRTFDLVVSGPTGVYLSDGIPLGSTIR